jgi:hypothetical protein
LGAESVCVRGGRLVWRADLDASYPLSLVELEADVLIVATAGADLHFEGW